MKTRILLRAAAVLAVFCSAAALAQPVVVVLDYGAEPREPIRYKFSVGPAEQATMSMSMQMTMSMGGVQTPGTSIPTISVPVTIRTLEVLPDGSARYEFAMAAATLDAGAGPNAAINQVLGASLGILDGSTGWTWVDARGNTLDGGFNLPNGVNPQIAQLMGSMQGQMQQMSAPFPAEAIGVGARWQLSTTMQLSGIAISQTTDYLLLARDGDTVQLEIAGAQTAATPIAAPPGVPPEALASLSDMNNTVSGTLTVDLTSAFADMEMTTGSSTTTGSMSMNSQMTMSLVRD